jgi:hypothetical protein
MGVAIGTDIILPPYLTHMRAGDPGTIGSSDDSGEKGCLTHMGSVGRAQFPAARVVARKRRSGRYGAPELAASTS